MKISKINLQIQDKLYPAGTKNSVTPQFKGELKPDTLELSNKPKSDNKKGLKIALGVLGSFAAIGGVIFAIACRDTKAAKQAGEIVKNGDRSIGGLDDLLHKTDIDDHKKITDNITESVDSKHIKGSAESIKKYLLPNALDSELAFSRDVHHIEGSVENDLNAWKKFRADSVHEFDHGKYGKINQDFTEFEILPHTYKDDTELFLGGRDGLSDFRSYKVENGYMIETSSLFHSTKEVCSSHFLEIQDDKRCLQTGIFDDGRQYVSATYTLGEATGDSRTNYETIMLVSKNGEFTQSQKDLIKAFEVTKGQKFKNDQAPMAIARYTYPDTHDGNHKFETNKNALLSAISSWAKNTPEFDIEKFIQEQGHTFRIGK